MRVAAWNIGAYVDEGSDKPTASACSSSINRFALDAASVGDAFVVEHDEIDFLSGDAAFVVQLTHVGAYALDVGQMAQETPARLRP